MRLIVWRDDGRSQFGHLRGECPSFETARLKKLKKNKQGKGASDDSSSSFSSSEYESSSDEDIHYTTVGFS
jgi:hypothetical protein